jgi:hypothetical protein
MTVAVTEATETEVTEATEKRFQRGGAENTVPTTKRCRSHAY